MTKEEAFAMVDADPLLQYRYNDAQKRFFEAIKDPLVGSMTMVILLKGNRAGGSFGLVSAWKAIMYGTGHPELQGSPFGDLWPFPRRSARLMAPIGSLEDKGPIQTALRDLFPPGTYHQTKGSGKGYYSQGSAPDRKWSWDVLTYDQSALQAAGANKDLILFSEPPPQALFTEGNTRLSGNGMLIAEFTRLDMAAFIDEYVDAGALILDGKEVGEVRVVTADIEDSCQEHHNGHQAHSAIRATIAAWPAEEREARRTGKPLRLSGRIYPAWGEANEIEALSDYHQKCWDQGRCILSWVVDPHDRKPWAMAWFLTFPNNDVIAIAEWPPFDFAAAKSSPVNHIEDYRGVILETEAEIGFPVTERRGDPNFCEAPKSGTGDSVRTMLAKPCRTCTEKIERSERRGQTLEIDCAHTISLSGAPDAISEGHILVRAAIGDASKNIRPKFYALRTACPNLCYGMRHYAYKEEVNPQKALSEKPQLVVKDFADLARYHFNAKLNIYPQEEKPVQLWAPRERGRGTHT